MEWQRHQKATPSERTFASSGRRVSAHPLEGLEPQAASTGVYATSPSSTRGGADRTRSFFRSNAPTCASVSCAAGALSADVSRAAGSQCSRFHIWTGDHQTVRRPSRLCHLARPGDSLNRALATPRYPLASDKHASPSGASCPLFLAVPQFLPSSALFARHPSVSATSHGLHVWFCTTFAHQIRT